jgi:hypothetical protein
MFDIEMPGSTEDGTPDPGTPKLPEGLAGMAPGADLARLLEGIEGSGSSGYDRVVVMQAWHRQVAHDQARFLSSMVEVAEAVVAVLSSDERPEELDDAVTSEIRAGLSWTHRAAQYQQGFARQLVCDYPQVWAALDSGAIDLPKARVIVDQTCHLDGETAGEVAAVALERASTQTTGQLRARLARLVISVNPDSAKARYERCVEDRRVACESNPEGTANIHGLDLPVGRANAVMRRINRLARMARGSHDQRSMDQVRADVFLDLLSGDSAKHRGGRGTVDIRVDLATLAGLAETPGELAGYGPVIADVARQITEDQEDAEWRVSVTAPDTGVVIHSGITRRRPTAAQQRQVETRNPTCIFPGCRMPSGECDLDHREPWADGGPTTVDNLSPLCRRDHRLKDKGWTIARLRPGIHHFTSPLGHTYTTGPDPP